MYLQEEDVVGRSERVLEAIAVRDDRLSGSRRASAHSVLLNRLVQLQPVHFFWKADEYPDRQFGHARSFGLIAQDAEKILPELVTEDASGYKAVRYNLLPLMTLQAIKELQATGRAPAPLLKGLEEIWGWSSETDGIRHGSASLLTWSRAAGEFRLRLMVTVGS